MKDLINKWEIDTTRFGDVLEQFGGMYKLDMFGIIDFIHNLYVDKTVIIYIKLDGKHQTLILNIKNFTIEIRKWKENGVYTQDFSYAFKFQYDDGRCLIVDDETRISLLYLSKN
jgi:hypothetical protein